MLAYGQEVTLSALVGGQDVENALGYVWKLWDGTKVVTHQGIIRAQVNRVDITAAVTACNYVGATSTAQYPEESAGKLPEMLGSSLNVASQVYPFDAQVSVSVPEGVTVSWFDSAGNLIGSTPNLTYSVASPEILRVRLESLGISAPYIDVYFNVAGVANTAPKATQLVQGARQVSIAGFIGPVSAATTVPVLLYGGATIDGQVLAPAWELHEYTYVYNSGARILVKNQASQVDNGIYQLACELPYTYVHGISYQPASATLSSDSGHISVVTADGVSASGALAQYLVVGAKLRLEQGTSFVEYKINQVTPGTTHYALVLELITSGGVLASGYPATLKFGWPRASTGIKFGAAVVVQFGATNGGGVYVARTPSSTKDYVPGVDKIQWGKVGSYAGTSSAGSHLYLDSSISEVDDQPITSDIQAPGANSTLILTPGLQYLLRVKASTEGVPGYQEITEAHTDVGSSQYFVPEVTTRTLRIRVL